MSITIKFAKPINYPKTKGQNNHRKMATMVNSKTNCKGRRKEIKLVEKERNKVHISKTS